MAAEQVYSNSVTNIASSPSYQPSSGQGASGRRIEVDDYVAPTAVGLQSTKSIYRILSFPSGAVIKSFIIASDVALDSSGPTLAFDFNVAWSNSTLPGWCPTAFQLAS